MVNPKNDIQKQSNKIIAAGIVGEILLGIIWGLVSNYILDNTAPGFSFRVFYIITTTASFTLGVIVASLLLRKEKNVAILITVILCLTVLGALSAITFTVGVGVIKWN